MSLGFRYPVPDANPKKFQGGGILGAQGPRLTCNLLSTLDFKA